MSKPAKDFVITDRRQKQKLIHGIGRELVQEAEDGTKKLARMLMPTNLEPEVARTLIQNAAARKAVAAELINNLGTKTDFPIRLENFFDQLMLAFSTSGIAKEYTDLAIGLRSPSANPGMTAALTADLPRDRVYKGSILAKSVDTSPLGLKCMKLRLTTIENIIRVACNEFYLAATSREEISYNSRDFKAFADQVIKLCGYAPGRGS